jgi:DNA polymerase III epsilon subunit-like protein
MSKINPYIIFDFETGGLDCTKNAATEIALLCVDGATFKEIGRYESYIHPYIAEYDPKALQYTNITMDMLVAEGKQLDVVFKEVAMFFKEMKEKTSNSHTKKPILVGHNAQFDIGFLQACFKASKLDLSTLVDGAKNFFGQYQPNYIDTVTLSKLAWGQQEDRRYNLASCVETSGV